MKRRFPLIISGLIGISLLAILFLGNNMLGRNNQRPDQNNTTQQGRNLIGENARGATPGPGNNTGLNRIGQQIQQQTGFDGQKAGNILTRLGNIDGVSKINTVVSGNTALVGYNATVPATDANTTRKMITDRVKQIDNTITNVVVSDSADISSRIGRLSDNIKNKSPMNDLNKEFNQLIQSIRPAAP